jgi:hypothetical protein
MILCILPHEQFESQQTLERHLTASGHYPNEKLYNDELLHIRENIFLCFPIFSATGVGNQIFYDTDAQSGGA